MGNSVPHAMVQRYALAVMDEERAKKECPVCLSELGARKRTVACGMCGRRFHRACWSAWQSRSHTCPMCRTVT